ncbi:helix-turn-helix transcriptional regulator [Neolewinella litorea]|nr:LuxR C-terminal-related transcriptional regulator [Neolewinella litorea]
MYPLTDSSAGKVRTTGGSSPSAAPLPPISPDPAFEHLLSQSSIYCYSVDYQTNRFRYVSPGIYRLLGYDRDSWQFSGPLEAFRQVHPDDRDCVHRIYSEINRELLRHDPAVRGDLSFVFTCRMKTRAGDFIHLSHHLSFPNLDHRGRPLADFTLVSDITALKVPQHCQLQIHYPTPTGNLICKTLSVTCTPAATELTRREIEILKLVAQGLDSQAIARQLFISYHTVCTHRKNLLRKAGVKSPVELVGWGRGVGVV